VTTAALAGRVVLVTGAGSGIGAAIAQQAASSGASLVLVDRDRSGLNGTVAGLSGPAMIAEADVTVGADIQRAVALGHDSFGRLDAIVNCAGAAIMGGTEDLDEDAWRRCLDVNLTGAWLVAKAAVPFLKGSDSAAIVNVASVAGLVGIAGAVAYCASKGGLLALTRAMAVDLAPEIRVNAVCPGTTLTPLVEDLLRVRGEGDRELGLARTAERYPAGRLATPGEIAAVVLFLIGDGASFCTGAAFTVDGGMTAV
jgi:NAD(P)-dependent dehydrogenase (short-subunit alcohol dehydrogenase family)